jgi:hypothetical protein
MHNKGNAISAVPKIRHIFCSPNLLAKAKEPPQFRLHNMAGGQASQYRFGGDAPKLRKGASAAPLGKLGSFGESHEIGVTCHRFGGGCRVGRALGLHSRCGPGDRRAVHLYTMHGWNSAQK